MVVVFGGGRGLRVVGAIALAAMFLLPVTEAVARTTHSSGGRAHARHGAHHHHAAKHSRTHRRALTSRTTSAKSAKGSAKPSPTASASPSPTATSTATASSSASSTATSSPTSTASGTPTSTATSTATANPAQFVGRNGATLTYRGSAFTFVGINAYGLASRGANTPAAPGCDGLTYSDADLDALFQALPANGVVRFWATSASTVADVGKVIAAAQRNNRLVIPSLFDSGGNCDRNGFVPTGSWFTSGYQADGFHAWATTVASTFANNTAVAMWEITNEPGWGQGGDLGLSRDQLRSYLSTVAGWIKAADPNHLVESGLMTSIAAIGPTGSTPTQMRANFAYVQNSPDLDVTSIHDYEYDYSGNTGTAGMYPIGWLPAAQIDLNKPIIVGEYGARTAIATGSTCRDSSLSLSSLVADKEHAYLGNGASGVLMWNWMKQQPGWVTGDGCTGGSSFYGTLGASSPVMTTIRTVAPTA